MQCYKSYLHISQLVNPFASEAVYTCNFFSTACRTACNTHSVFWEFFRKPCQHATRGCDKRWMTCIHAGFSRSPREHASVPPDKRHCRQWMSSLFCGFLPNPFIHDLFCWSSRHKFVKTDLYSIVFDASPECCLFDRVRADNRPVLWSLQRY